MTDPTPTRAEALADIAAGYAQPDRNAKTLARRAAAYNPDHVAEADRIRAAYKELGEPIPPQLLMSIGYAESARDAAHELDEGTN